MEGVIYLGNKPRTIYQPAAQEQTKVTTAGLNDFANRVTSGSVVPLIDHTETLWNSEAIWTKRPSGSAIGKIVFMLGSS